MYYSAGEISSATVAWPSAALRRLSLNGELSGRLSRPAVKQRVGGEMALDPKIDMGHCHFLNSTGDMGNNKRQRHAT